MKSARGAPRKGFSGLRVMERKRNPLPEPKSDSQSEDTVVRISREIVAHQASRRRRNAERFMFAALSAIPWFGSFISAAASTNREESSVRSDELRTQWLEVHQERLNALRETLDAIHERFDSLEEEIELRLESDEYLALVRQSFRVWDQAETEEKRRLVANLIVKCAATRVCSDDIIRLFISWLQSLHESHLAVIREIHQNPGCTRYDVWATVYGELPREDSAEADLYKMLIRDLSMGGVIRQVRDTNELGEFVRKRAPKKRGPAPITMQSAFDDEESYALTQLGTQFVHYTMNEAVSRLEQSN